MSPTASPPTSRAASAALNPAATDPQTLDHLRAGRLAGFNAAIERRIFTELGAGALDLPGVVGALAERGYDGWLMVEQDSSWGPPSESAAIGRRVLAETLRRLSASRGPASSPDEGGRS